MRQRHGPRGARVRVARRARGVRGRARRAAGHARAGGRAPPGRARGAAARRAPRRARLARPLPAKVPPKHFLLLTHRLLTDLSANSVAVIAKFKSLIFLVGLRLQSIFGYLTLQLQDDNIKIHKPIANFSEF